jgi:4-amino-4-deoxy-L-arabinose transferase
MIIFNPLKSGGPRGTFPAMHPKTTISITIGLLLLFAVVYLLPLNVRELGIPDEMRYGEIAREMLASGDFVVPRLDGLRYFEKPAGGHVLNAAAMAVFGETNFAVRLMSALATGLTAWALFLFMKRRFSAEAAALGAFIFLTCGEIMGVGTYSVLDSMETCFITLSICCFYPALEAAGMRRAGWLALIGIFSGGAFLVKGFIAFAVPVMVFVPFLLIQRRWKELFTLPWIPLAAAVAVSLPWSLAIAAREPDFWRYFFWEEHIRRFFSQAHAQHDNPFWYFIPVFIAGAIPWSLIAPLPLRDLLRRRLGEPAVRFALVWLIAPFLFFSASSGKLGTYILPCFPPFAMLLAMALNDRFGQASKNRFLLVGIAMLGIVILALIVIVPVAGVLNAFHLLPPLDAHFALKFCGLLAGFGLAFWLVAKAYFAETGMRKCIGFGLSAAMLFVGITFCVPTEADQTLGIQGFLESERHHIGPDTLVVANQKTVHAACYVYKRDDIYLFNGMGELAYGLSYPDSEHRHLSTAALRELLLQRGDRRVVVAIRSSPDDLMRADLPEPAYQRQWLNIWFAVYEPHARTHPPPEARTGKGLPSF